MRLRTFGVALGSILTVASGAAAPAPASTTRSTSASSLASSSAGSSAGSPAGGTTAGALDTSAAGGASPATTTEPAAPRHHAPVTAKTPNIAYKGPVYEKTPSGQILPYTPPANPAGAGTAPSGTAGAGAIPGSGTASSGTASTAAGSTAAGITAGSATAATATTEGNGTAATATGAGGATGGSAVGPTASTTTKPELLVPGHTARIIDGLAAAPIDAPAAVQAIVWAGNQIVGLPYIYGGGHASFVSPGYDCSGTVSYALHGASLLASPMDSTEFESWGGQGIGTWVTIFANGGHAYMTVAGIRLDTSPADDPSGLQGPRWRPLRPANAGFVVRHPVGL